MKKGLIVWTAVAAAVLLVTSLACAKATPTPATPPAPKPATQIPAAATPAATPKPPRPLTLTFHFAAPVPKVLPNIVAYEKLVTNVKERTGGDLVINFLIATLTQDYNENVEMLKSGAIDITDIVATAAAIPEIEVLQIPYLYRDYPHMKKVLQGDIGKQITAKIEAKYPVKFMIWTDYGFRQFFTKAKPINKPDDLKGLKMRVMPSPPLVDTVNALGGSAIGMSWGDFVSGLQQGVVDGGDLPVVNIWSLKMWQYGVKYASLSSHFFGQSVVLMNRNSWNKLTKAEQDILMDEFLKARDWIWQENDAADKKAAELLEPNGIKVNPVDLTPFRDTAVGQVYPKYQAKYGKDLVDSIIAVK